MKPARGSWRAVVVLTLAFGSIPLAVECADRYVHVRLEGPVDVEMGPLIRRAVAEAQSTSSVSGIFVDIDTDGGRMEVALRIREQLSEAGVPIVCYVNDDALSAGALICLSATTIDVAPGGRIGAGRAPGTAAPSGAVVDYLRKEFAKTADRFGHSRELAEAMVDQSIELPGVVAAGELLTLTSEEAVSAGLAARSSLSLDEALFAAGLVSQRPISLKQNWAEALARFLTRPVVSGALLALGFLGILIESKTPGWGVPGTIGLSCLLVFFTGHRIALQAGWEDLALIGLGLLLIALEVFVIPGHGVAGIIGVIALLCGLVLAMVDRDLQAALLLGQLGRAISTVSAAVLTFAVGVVVLVRYLPDTRFMRRTVILGDRLDGEANALDDDLSSLLGKEGVARTLLRPSGAVVIDGRRVDAETEGEIIEPGAVIEVIGLRPGGVIVREQAGEIGSERNQDAPLA